MRRLLARLSLFVSPFLLALCLELFVLPVDVFTFRIWEALSVRKFRSFLPGDFIRTERSSKSKKGIWPITLLMP